MGMLTDFHQILGKLVPRLVGTRALKIDEISSAQVRESAWHVKAQNSRECGQSLRRVDEPVDGRHVRPSEQELTGSGGSERVRLRDLSLPPRHGSISVKGRADGIGAYCTTST